MDATIEIRDLTKHFGNKAAVDHVRGAATQKPQNEYILHKWKQWIVTSLPFGPATMSNHRRVLADDL